MGDAQRAPADDLLFREARRLEIHGVAQGDQLVRLLVLLEHLEQTRSPVRCTSAAFLQRVVLRVPRQLDHVLGQRDGVVDPTDMDEVANQPLVVVREVVNLIGHDPVAHHLGMIDAGGSLLLPGGIGVSMQARENMPRHVPHVRDARGRLTQQGGGLQGPLGLFSIPQMNAKVVRRVHRLDREYLFEQRIDGLVARNGQIIFELPKPHGQKRLGFRIVRMRMNDRLETPQVLTPSLLAITGFVLEIRFVPLDPQTLARIHARHALAGLGDKPLRPFAVLEVCHGHAPIGHGALGVEHRRLPKGALGFKIPEPVQLPDALIEQRLNLRHRCRDGKGNFSRSPHEKGFLSWPLVEGFTVEGVTGQNLDVGLRRVGRFALRTNDETGRGRKARRNARCVYREFSSSHEGSSSMFPRNRSRNDEATQSTCPSQA